MSPMNAHQSFAPPAGTGSRNVARAALATLVALGAAALSGCTEGVLTPLGPVGAQERQYLFEAMAVMLLVVVPVIVLTLVFAWWFRASNERATYLPTWDYSGKIEFTVWIIPILVVLFLAGVTYVGSHELDPYRPLKGSNKSLRVQVVSLDWKWLFIYPDLGVASLNELGIPVDTPISFNLTSASVMNAIFVPGMGSQIYTMAGMCTQMSFISDHTNVYRGVSTQFSGDGFSDMHFSVLSLEKAGFDGWVGSLRRSGNILDKAAYEKLLATRAAAQPTHYTLADNDLFRYALQRSTKEAGDVMSMSAHSDVGICRDMTLSNGVN